jgi:deoxyribose-phosphate aldolase
MRTELLCDESKYPDILACIFEASTNNVDQICTPSGLIPRIGEEFIRDHCDFSAIIDFPYGISETKIRIHEILLCQSRGVKTIDLVINRYDTEDGNLHPIRKDFKICHEICKGKGLRIRPVVEYRLADNEFLPELCLLLRENGADEIVLGTGSVVDDILDNIICSRLIEENLDINIVSCFPVLSQGHYDMFNSSKIHGIRIKSYKILDNLCNIG